MTSDQQGNKQSALQERILLLQIAQLEREADEAKRERDGRKHSTGQQERLRAHRTHLAELAERTQGELDKTLITLSSAGLGVTLVVVKDFVEPGLRSRPRRASRWDGASSCSVLPPLCSPSSSAGTSSLRRSPPSTG